jgi:hypothetical protein
MAKAGGYTKKGKKDREKMMKEAGTWLKKKRGMKMGDGLYRK